jgi:DNA-binding phage protein
MDTIRQAVEQHDAALQPDALIRALEGAKRRGYKNVAEELGMNYRTVLNVSKGKRAHFDTVVSILNAYGWTIRFEPIDQFEAISE